MKDKLKSRKLWVAVGGVVAVMMTDWLNLSPEMSESIVTALVTIVVAYVGGQSLVDAAKGLLDNKKK
jgi:divalent metal cation (Fe/Co/Zn/Cd) transporter